MRKLLAVLMIWGFASMADAQVVEINPNVEWTYVRSQKIELLSENVYQFEFPAVSNNEYMFNMFFTDNYIGTAISIFDLQMKPIAELREPHALGSSKLGFKVPASGTYIVVIGFSDREDSPEAKTVAFDVSLIKRPIVAE